MELQAAPRHLPVLGASHKLAPASVRLSLTDRCDLACVYCRPSRNDGYFEKRLSDTAWRTMIEGLFLANVRRFRITGGEPLLHPEVVEMVRFIASLGPDDIALTTNGTRLAPLAARLREAGLKRLTLSLDSLDPTRFWRLTRGGRLDTVLEGAEAARKAGFDELKINTVVLRGENSDELESITQWAWNHGFTPRFIEIMRIGEGARLPPSSLVPLAEMRESLAHLLDDAVLTQDPGRGPARYVASRGDPARRVGFISGTTDTFCGACDRLRVASDGTLRPCLATNDGVSGMAAATHEDSAAVRELVVEAWKLKPDGEVWKGCTEETAADVSMRSIGG